ncbi:hypothetical protein JCM8547_004294 [Rhodosporidiobolus lusitaniae]
MLARTALTTSRTATRSACPTIRTFVASPSSSQLARLVPHAAEACSRAFSSSSIAREAGGFQNLIQPTDNDPVSITSLTPSAGFTFSDGLVCPSPVLLFDGAIFLWDVQQPTSKEDAMGMKWDGWNEEKLRVFEVLSPRPEILLVGTGKTTCFPPPFFKRYLNNLGIQVDVLDSRNAASTYNLLVEEGRRVAAALYPVIERAARTGVVA